MPHDFFGTRIKVDDYVHWTSWAKDIYGKKQGGRDGIVTKVTEGTVTVMALADDRDHRGWVGPGCRPRGSLITLKIQGRRSGYREGANPFDTVVVIPEEAHRHFNVQSRVDAILTAYGVEDA